MKVFVAGATGVIGRRLLPLLVGGGHQVAGTTRLAQKAKLLDGVGAQPFVLDVYDAAALARAVQTFAPAVIIHQLTDLPDVIDPATFGEAAARNSRLRVEGTRNLMAAATRANVGRVIAQSIAFVYAPGREPHAESDPLDSEGAAKASVAGVVALETAVTTAPGIAGLVLRYGRLYGEGTWSAGREKPPALHVDAAAQAALLAVTRGAPGIYNIAEDDGAVTITKAVEQFGFDPDFRIKA